MTARTARRLALLGMALGVLLMVAAVALLVGAIWMHGDNAGRLGATAFVTSFIGFPLTCVGCCVLADLPEGGKR